MGPRARASQEQFAILIDFMERHGDIARPQPGPQGRITSERLWAQIANTLNSLGGDVKKTSDKWKKVWADWKSKTKKKHLTLRQHASGTGGGPNNRTALTVLEERVVAVTRVSAVVRQAGIEEQGFNVSIKGIIYSAYITFTANDGHLTEKNPIMVTEMTKNIKARDRRLHEREMEGLRLEAQRVEVVQQNNTLLRQLGLLAQILIDIMSQQQPYSSLPSTDPI